MKLNTSVPHDLQGPQAPRQRICATHYVTLIACVAFMLISSIICEHLQSEQFIAISHDEMSVDGPPGGFPVNDVKFPGLPEH